MPRRKRAAARSTRRKGTERHVAVAREGGRVREMITETIPSQVANDEKFRNARQNSDAQNARIEHDKALVRVMMSLMKDDAELFKQFTDNASFKRWMADTVFELAYDRTGTAS